MIYRLPITISCIVLSVLAPARCCHAGRLQNDRVTAAAAWDFLRPDKEGRAIARQACLMLDSLPRVKYRLDDSVPAGTPDDLRPACIFVEASTWPDRIANSDDIDHAEDRPSWHRIAIPLNLDGIEGPEPSRKLELNGKKPLELAMNKDSSLNLVQALELNEILIKDPATPRERRAIAMCWFLNLMAEIHQPSNSSSMFAKDFPNGDDCGTRYMVRDHGQIKDWHSVWDSMGDPETSSLDTVRQQATPHGRTTPGIEDVIDEEPDYASWALHAHYYDRNVRQTRFIGGVNSEKLKVDKNIEIPELPECFFVPAADYMQQRHELGGYRTSLKLRKIFR